VQHVYACMHWLVVLTGIPMHSFRLYVLVWRQEFPVRVIVLSPGALPLKPTRLTTVRVRSLHLVVHVDASLLRHLSRGLLWWP
jgi:hypothetical protein